MKKSRATQLILTTISLAVFGLTPITIKAQPPIKDLRVIGNFVNFQFNSIAEFESGITLTGWTKVKIRYQYTSKEPWKLVVYSLEGSIRYEGDPINDIPLTHLQIIPTITNTNDATASVNGTFALSNSDIAPNAVLVSGNGIAAPTIVTLELSISYKLGIPPNNLQDKPGGCYYTPLRFLLVEQ